MFNLPSQFVDAAKSEHTYTPKRYSVTSLLKGSCEAVLQRRHDDEIVQDVSDMVWLIFGTAVHKILEEGREEDTELKECWISMDVPGTDGYVMSGQFDSYNDRTGLLTDWKTASVWKVQFNDWEDYRTQLLYYCVLMRANGFNAHAGQVVALLKDWSATKAETDRDYPQHPVFIIGWEYTESELRAAEAAILKKFAEIAVAEATPDADLIPCSPEERWEKSAKYAVKKKGNVRASKLCDTEEEALAIVSELEEANPKVKYEVEHRPAEYTKCTKYCTVTRWCPFYQKEIADAGE